MYVDGSGNFFTANNLGATAAVGGSGSGGGSAWSTFPPTQTVNMCNYGLINVGSVGIGTTGPTVALDVSGQMRSRVVISNITTTAATIDFTQSTGNAVYNYLTNTGFNAITLSNPGSGYIGAFATFKNTTTTGMSVVLTYSGGATGPASPLLLYASGTATLIWTGTNYVQF
jgi:hypothetical protein